MKFLKNVDFVAQTNTPQETLTLLSLLKVRNLHGVLLSNAFLKKRLNAFKDGRSEMPVNNN